MKKNNNCNHHHFGLTSQQVLESRARHGANLLQPPKRAPWWKQLAKEFDDPIIRILVIAALLAIVTGQAVESIGILIAIVLATVLAFLNERQAEKEFDILNQVNNDTPVKVIREGKAQEIPKKDVVVGDIVLVDQGEELPADMKFIEAFGILLDQSRLTGESVPVPKRTWDDAQRNPPKEEETYPCWMGLKGTPVAEGHAVGEVIAVGSSTELGKTALAAAEVTDEQTPLMKQLDRLAEQIGAVGMTAAALTFLVLVLHGALSGSIVQTTGQWLTSILIFISATIAMARVWLPSFYTGAQLLKIRVKKPAWLENAAAAGWVVPCIIGAGVLAVGIAVLVLTGAVQASPSTWIDHHAAGRFVNFFMVAVALIVMAMPEGLPMSVTLALAYSMRKMVATNNLVRRMHACETIGAATVICTDKTGTLTRNQMRVQQMSVPERLYPILEAAIAGNSTAELSINGEEEPSPLGNPTEGALLLWLHAHDKDYNALRSTFHFTADDQWPFTTELKFMATRGNAETLAGKPVLFLKGAPEFLLAKCTLLGTAGEDVPATDERRREILKEVRSWQERGMRTLGFAYREEPDMDSRDVHKVAQDLLWLGFAAIADPVRPEVPGALEECRDAGITVKMVTGDSPDTAREIARQSNLLDADGAPDEDALITGAEFQALSDEEALVAAKRIKVMARARPNDKLRLVNCLKAQDEVVAVTGDGTNDAPALNRADVGIAMGKTGTSVAKEAADIILLDDSFPSIVNAVMWGRSLYRNLQKFLLFQITINFIALTIAILGPFLDIELPLTVIQVLWINLIMDTFAAIALATDPPNPAVMKEPPRHPGDFIVSGKMGRQILVIGVLCIALLTGFLLYMKNNGVVLGDNWNDTDQYSRLMLTRFFCIFVMLQFWNLFNVKCWGTNDTILKHLADNKTFLGITAVILIAQILIVTFGGRVFRTVPLNVTEWLEIILGTSVILWFSELARFVSGKTTRK